MFSNAIKYQEIFQYYPRLANWVDSATLNTVINAASQVVGNDLRRKGIDTAKVYIPLMFDSLAFGQSHTQTDYTSDPISIGNERRLIVEITSTTGCTFTASGSIDNVYYSPLKGIDDTDLSIAIANGDTGKFSAPFLEGYRYVKYSINGSATYFAFLVDTAFDFLVMQKVVQQATMPLLGSDSVADEMFRASTEMYNNLLMSQTYDYDLDADGSIASTEKDIRIRYRVMR